VNTNLELFITPTELRDSLSGKVAAVIDVLRATTTIIEAMANGARSVHPTVSVEDAVDLANRLGRADVVLSGERHARPIEGFDLGNSPREFTAEAVSGKIVVMTTTNGTPALEAASAAEQCVVAAYANLQAVAERIAQTDQPIAIICAGRSNAFSLDDVLCAGALIRAIRARRSGTLVLNDAAIAARALEQQFRSRLARVFARTAAARQIVDAGLAEDVAYCLMQDRHSVVPVAAGRQITL
jgi:2-phosphosulfolactate phosphatase